MKYIYVEDSLGWIILEQVKNDFIVEYTNQPYFCRHQLIEKFVFQAWKDAGLLIRYITQQEIDKILAKEL